MKDKRNPLEKFLDRTIVFTFKQLGAFIIVCLGIGALIALISFEIGVIVIGVMIIILCFKILPYVIRSKGAP